MISHVLWAALATLATAPVQQEGRLYRVRPFASNKQPSPIVGEPVLGSRRTLAFNLLTSKPGEPWVLGPAALFRNGSLRPLLGLSGTEPTYPVSVTSRGQALGGQWGGYPAAARSVTLRWDEFGTPTRLREPSWATRVLPVAINDSGVAIATAFDSSTEQLPRAIMWLHDVLHEVPAPPGPFPGTTPTGLSEDGWIAYNTGPQYGPRGGYLVPPGGAPFAVPPPMPTESAWPAGVPYGVVYDVARDGLACGAPIQQVPGRGGVVWEAGVAKLFRLPEGLPSYMNMSGLGAINDRGDAVGAAWSTLKYGQVAPLVRRGDRLEFLNGLILPEQQGKWWAKYVIDIAEDGTILAFGHGLTHPHPYGVYLLFLPVDP